MSGSDRVRYVSVVEDMEEGAGGDEAGNSPESSLGHGPKSEFSAMFGNRLDALQLIRGFNGEVLQMLGNSYEVML